MDPAKFRMVGERKSFRALMEPAHLWVFKERGFFVSLTSPVFVRGCVVRGALEGGRARVWVLLRRCQGWACFPAALVPPRQPRRAGGGGGCFRGRGRCGDV